MVSSLWDRVITMLIQWGMRGRARCVVRPREGERAMCNHGRLFLFGLAACLFAVSAVALPRTTTEGAHDTGGAPRSQIDPARLNIDLIADGYGLIPPCQSNPWLYTPHTTPPRANGGLVVVTDADGVVLSERAELIGLSPSGGGMHTARISVGPVAGYACQHLSARFEVRSCLGEAGDTIDCPEIRVRRPQAFEEFSVQGEDLSICLAD